MKVRFHRNFERNYQKLPKKEQGRFKERINLFTRDEFDPLLNNHPLYGKYKGYRSINITGNLRAIYKLETQEVRIFIAVGSHGELYK